jgi:carbon storage regulator
MLVLTRKIGETIEIGTEIEVKVVDVKRGEVRIGIKAPDTFRISRGEAVRKTD